MPLQPAQWEDVQRRLRDLARSCLEIAESMPRSAKRDERNLALFGILRRTGVEAAQCANALINSPVECVAWAARNLFELNLVLRYILESDIHLREWTTQAGTDEIDIIEGAIALHEGASDPTLVEALDKAKRRRTEIEGVLSRDGRKRQSPFRVEALARAVGMEEEYRAFFRLYSKYVHPSSWLANREPDRVQGWEWRTIFSVNAQLYAADTIARIQDVIGSKSTA